MTYNFDPDRWYDDQCARIDGQVKSGALTAEAARLALDDIERRYATMVARLDGTFSVQRDDGRCRHSR
ncbi:MAG TPA: hypothetical protein VGK32_09375 [Vicinamibacterales bacterium]